MALLARLWQLMKVHLPTLTVFFSQEPRRMQSNRFGEGSNCHLEWSSRTGRVDEVDPALDIDASSVLPIRLGQLECGQD